MPCVHRNLITVEISSRLHILIQVTNIQPKPFLTHCPSCTLYTAHNLGRIFKLHSCLYTMYKFPLPHAMKYWSTTTVQLQATCKTFSHLHHSFNQPDACRTYSMFTQSKYYHTTTICTVKFLTNRPMSYLTNQYTYFQLCRSSILQNMK